MLTRKLLILVGILITVPRHRALPGMEPEGYD